MSVVDTDVEFAVDDDATVPDVKGDAEALEAGDNGKTPLATIVGVVAAVVLLEAEGCRSRHCVANGEDWSVYFPVLPRFV